MELLYIDTSKQGMAHMIRKLAMALLIVGASLVSNFATALGLGELKLNSALNEKFNAEIKLLNVGELSKNEILPNLASHEDFARAGVERVFFLTSLKFDVRVVGDGTAYITLTSDKIVREPFLNFLVELHWPSGRILREYTVLVDPPIFSETPVATVSKPSTRPPLTSKKIDSPASTRNITQQVSQPARSSASSGTVSSGSRDEGVTVAVKKNDTLWGIARDNRPSREVSISQTMLAIQKDNPHAFIRNNINLLKAGQVLKIPSADKIKAFSNREAFVETQRQEDEWKSNRPIDARQEDEAIAAKESSESQEAAEEETSEASSAGQLKLLTDDAQSESLARDEEVAASGASLDEVSDESLAVGVDSGSSSVVNQDVAADLSEKGAGAEASSSVKALEEQVDSLKKLLNLKDQQLAMLQAAANQSTSENTSIQSEDAFSKSQTALAQVANESVSENKPRNQMKKIEETSFLDSLMESPMYIGLAILAVLVGLVILGALSRRKNTEADYPADLQTALSKSESDVQLPKDLEDELERESALAAAAIADNDEDIDQMDDVDEFDLPELETDINKLTEEADIYIAYGRYERALDMLQPAVEQHPESVQLHLKLAEVYAATGDSQGLAKQKETIEALGDDAALSVLAGLKQKQNDVAPDAVSAIVNPEPKQEINPLGKIDQGLPSLNDFDDEVVDTSEEFASADEDALEFTLDDLELNQNSELVEDASYDDTDDADDLDFLGDTDEATTKLDLARAYIEMADKEAALDILNEVLEEGSDEQQDEARKLLESIA